MTWKQKELKYYPIQTATAAETTNVDDDPSETAG